MKNIPRTLSQLSPHQQQNEPSMVFSCYHGIQLLLCRINQWIVPRGTTRYMCGSTSQKTRLAHNPIHRLSYLWRRGRRLGVTQRWYIDVKTSRSLRIITIGRVERPKAGCYPALVHRRENIHASFRIIASRLAAPLILFQWRQNHEIHNLVATEIGLSDMLRCAFRRV